MDDVSDDDVTVTSLNRASSASVEVTSLNRASTSASVLVTSLGIYPTEEVRSSEASRLFGLVPHDSE